MARPFNSGTSDHIAWTPTQAAALSGAAWDGFWHKVVFIRNTPSGPIEVYIDDVRVR